MWHKGSVVGAIAVGILLCQSMAGAPVAAGIAEQVASAPAGVSAASTAQLSYGRLLDRLTDLAGLAVLPLPGERLAQYAGQNAHDEVPDGPMVLAQMQGAGVIWRIFAANPGRGHVRMYIDGESHPVVDLPFADYFTGQRAPFAYPGLSYTVARGGNLYVPIPYSASCRIEADPGWGEYYQITYSSLPAGTTVPAFGPQLVAREASPLRRLSNTLLNPGQSPGYAGEAVIQKTVHVAPGETARVATVQGARAITSLRVQVSEVTSVPVALLGMGTQPYERRSRLILPEDPAHSELLRELSLSICWDGAEQPDVWAPLGDFFGTAPGFRQYKTLPVGALTNLYSYWYMPFADGAVVEVTNDGGTSRTLDFTITHAPLARPIDELGRLHAKWHRTSSPAPELLAVKGTGRYAGAFVHVYNPQGGGWNTSGAAAWVDGERALSAGGTLSDHYFGYAYGSPELFSRAFHSQIVSPRTGGIVGHTAVGRWHVADNIPFQESLEVALGGDTGAAPVECAVTAFWYQKAGEHDNYHRASLEERVSYSRQGLANSPNVYEGEDLRVVAVSRGRVTPLILVGQGQGGWSGRNERMVMLWTGPGVGDTLDLALPVGQTGYYQVWAQFSKAHDHGVYRFYLDGSAVGDPINLYHSGMVPTGNMDLGTHMLTEGEHTLRVEALGIDQLLTKKVLYGSNLSAAFGLDYVALVPAAAGEPRPAIARAGGGSAAPPPLVEAGSFTRIYNPSAGGGPPMINDHTFILGPDQRWYMWGITGGFRLAQAVADRLTEDQWTEQPPMEPVWHPWREVHLWAPHIVFHNGLYYMFYCGGDVDPTKYRISLATSPNLQDWQRYPGNPLFVDGFDARDPMVLRIGDEWVMYYTATSTPEGGNHVVAYRTSSDLIHWNERQIAFTDPAIGKAGGPTESPFVVRRDEYFYLFIGPRRGYVGTDVFRSRDPFHWELADLAGHIPAHAAEVVCDTDGQWYISHGGAGQGGLYLAPLLWRDGLP